MLHDNAMHSILLQSGVFQ